jgi:hypothetical protein
MQFDNATELNDFINTAIKNREALGTKVKITLNLGQTLKIICDDLIAKRNHVQYTGDEKMVSHFDAVLRYYMDADEFEKYVIQGKKIKT